MPAFNKITDHLYQGSYPESFEYGIDYDIVINVSDSPCASLSEKSPHFYKQPIHFWFPINEWSRIPYEPFYAAKRVIDANPGKKVLIHCHGGVNRSQLVTYSYLLSNGQEGLFPGAKKWWELFMKNDPAFTTKPPPKLEEFLKLMNKHQTFSVAGVLGELLNKTEDREVIDYLNSRY